MTFFVELKQHVTGQVRFIRLANKELWYKCEDGFEFPVPLSDTDGAEFEAEDKGAFFMRWIRKHMEMISAAKAE